MSQNHGYQIPQLSTCISVLMKLVNAVDNNLYTVLRDVLYQILKSTRLLSKPSQKPAVLGQLDYSMDSVTAVPSVLRSGILIVTL